MVRGSDGVVMGAIVRPSARPRALLPAQHLLPQRLGLGREHVRRAAVDDVPGALGDLVLELARRPPCVTGVDPDGREVGHRVDRIVVEVDEPERPREPPERLRLGAVVRSGQQAEGEGVVVRDRASGEQHVRPGGPAVPRRQDRAHGHVGGPVEDQAEAALLVVVEQEDHRAREVLVAEHGSGHQQPPGQRQGGRDVEARHGHGPSMPGTACSRQVSDITRSVAKSVAERPIPA
jgi:hypothetical protein